MFDMSLGCKFKAAPDEDWGLGNGASARTASRGGTDSLKPGRLNNR
jgi:hypothetical protein